MPPLIIGISGPTHSGKSVLARRVQAQLGESLCAVIGQDAYYKDLSHLSFEQRCQVNYDHPDTFEQSLLVEHIAKLIDGSAINMPSYDYIEHLRSGETSVVDPRPVIIIEGILIYTIEALLPLFDLKVYVDVPIETCLVRRLRGDTTRRGRSLETVLNQFENLIHPMYDQYVAPTRNIADVRINHGGESDEASDLLCGFINQRLQRRS